MQLRWKLDGSCFFEFLLKLWIAFFHTPCILFLCSYKLYNPAENGFIWYSVKTIEAILSWNKLCCVQVRFWHLTLNYRFNIDGDTYKLKLQGALEIMTKIGRLNWLKNTCHDTINLLIFWRSRTFSVEDILLTINKHAVIKWSCCIRVTLMKKKFFTKKLSINPIHHFMQTFDIFKNWILTFNTAPKLTCYVSNPSCM